MDGAMTITLLSSLTLPFIIIDSVVMVMRRLLTVRNGTMRWGCQNTLHQILKPGGVSNLEKGVSKFIKGTIFKKMVSGLFPEDPENPMDLTMKHTSCDV